MPSIRDVLLNIDGDSGGAESAIARVAAGLEGLDGQEATATVELARAQFERELAEVEAQLAALDKEEVEPKVKIRVDSMRADMERLAKNASTAFDRYFQPTFSHGRRTGIIGDGKRLSRELAPLAGVLEGIGRGAEQLEDDLAKAGFSLWDLAGRTRDMTELGQVFIAVLVAGMVPALLALAGSFVAAVGGAGALSAAFVGALIPAALGAIAVFMRFGKILEVAKQMETANRDEAYQNAQAQQSAATAADARHAAMIAVRDALQAVTRAERDYADAVKEAEEDIAEARERAQDAEENLSAARRRANRSADDAHRRVRETTKAVKAAVKDAYTYWIDLINEVKRDYLDLEGAQLGVLDAQLALSDAQANYNALLNEIPADKLGDVLQKLNDVNLPADQVKAFIAAAMGADADPRYADKLYRSSLKLKHAQHDLKVAQQALSDATLKLARDQGELATFTEKGVAAYGPYTDAVAANKDAKRDENRILADNRRALAEATEKVREARRELREYVKAGRNTRQVKNALDAVRDAQERLSDAHRQARRAMRGVAGAADHMSSAAARLKTDLENLTPAERAVLYALVGRDGKGGLKAAFREAFGTDVVMRSMAGFLRSVTGLLKDLSPLLKPLSQTWADIIDGASKAVRGQGIRDFFASMINAARTLLEVSAGGFKDFLGALANIARLATPGLIMIFNDMASAMREIREATEKPGAGNAIGVMIDSFRAWGGFVKSLIVGFGRLAVVMAPFGNEILKWLSDGADKLGKWASSAEGNKKITAFFRDTLPLAKSLAGLVGNIVVAFLEFLQFSAPIFKPLVDMLSSMVKWFGRFMGLLSRMIPRPIRELVGHFASIFGFAPKIVAWLGKLPGILGDIAKFIGSLGIVDAIVDAVEGAAEAVTEAAKGVAAAIVGGIKTGVTGAIDLAKWLLDTLGSASDLGGQVLGWITGGLANAASTVASPGATIVGWMQKGLGSLSSWGVDILDYIRGAISKAADTVAGAGEAIGGWIVKGLRGSLELGGKILGWIGRALRDAARKATGAGRAVASFILKGLAAALNVGARVVRWIANGVRAALRAGAGLGRAVANFILRGLQAGIGGVRKVLDWIFGGIRLMWGFLTNVGKTIADGLWNGLKSLPGKLWDAIKGLADKAAGFATDKRAVGASVPLGTSGVVDPMNLSHDIFTGVVHGFAAAQPWITGIVRNALTDAFAAVGAPAASRAVPALAAAVGASVPAARSAVTSRVPVSSALAAGLAADTGGGKTELHDHLHVHGHTRKVDPDPRTLEALQAKRRRKKGTSRP